MVADVIEVVPPWVILGIVLGSGASVVVAVVFYVGYRLSPPVEHADHAETGGSDARRRREIRDYLTAVDERFRENHSVGGVTVPFYLPERDVAITFDAHDYFRLEGEGVFTILCEHELPGRGLGRRLPFDVADPTWESDRSSRTSARDPVGAAFDELGLSTTADAEEIKRAYRERIKDVHPDHGGDEEAFRRVREAYTTARDYADGSRDRVEPAHRFGR